MKNFKIVTDVGADLPKSYLEEHDIDCMSITYMLDGEEYNQENPLDEDIFYARVREGCMPTTAQTNPAEARTYFERYLEEDKNLLCLAFSSGLSGTCNNIRMAAEELMEERGDCNIIVIDTLAASLGQGLLVYKAVQMRDAGSTMQETADWIEQHVQNFVHVFTVDDLNHLYRGGRVNKAAAVVGTIAGIKPILHVDNEGHLIPVSKVRGRKKSLMALVDYMEAHQGSYAGKNDIVFISHGDAGEDAELVRAEIEKRFGIHNFIINYIGPVIGSHAGPGTIALFFLGDER